MMKKKICALCMILGLLVPIASLPGYAGAADVFQICDSTAKNTDVCKDARSQSGNPFTSTLKTVVNILSLVVGVAAIISLIVGGLRMILAQGDPSSVASARQTIIYSLVGVAIAAVAQVIVVFVLNKL